MTELIATIVLVTSFCGMSFIVLRKIPILVNLSLPEVERTPSSASVLKLKERIFNSFSLVDFLEKTLLKIKILTLKIENKITLWLEKLRRHSQNQKNHLNDNYWDELKKVKNGK